MKRCNFNIALLWCSLYSIMQVIMVEMSEFLEVCEIGSKNTVEMTDTKQIIVLGFYEEEHE